MRTDTCNGIAYQNGIEMVPRMIMCRKIRRKESTRLVSGLAYFRFAQLCTARNIVENPLAAENYLR